MAIASRAERAASHLNRVALFELHEGQFHPQLPLRRGRLLVPDGVQFFSAQDVAWRQRRPVRNVREDWLAVWAGYVLPADVDACGGAK